jgi:hypothetical protein
VLINEKLQIGIESLGQMLGNQLGMPGAGIIDDQNLAAGIRMRQPRFTAAYSPRA